MASEPENKVADFLKKLDPAIYLAKIIRREPHLELTKPPLSGELWFRYTHTGVNDLDMEGINRMILYELWKTETLSIEEDRVEGSYTLYAQNLDKSNYMDLDILIERVTSIGRILITEYL
ncbi:hypothetical protein GF326_04330 [Candidatus Bathyarchaeota archaeon]|nr:hypothetical protein [Candidatus Bathyarchaeota archaeon]